MTLRRVSRGTLVAALAVFIAALPLFIALFAVPVVPSHDGPKNLYASHLLWHAHEPAFAHAFDRSRPVTALGFALVYGVFETVLPWRLAYAIAVLVGVALMPVGLFLMARALHPQRAALGLVGIGAAYQWTSHMGFVNYVGSVGLGFIAVGLALRSSWSLRRELGIYACVLAACLYHPFGAQFASVAILVQRLAHTSRRRAIRELGAVVIGCSPAALVTLIAQANLEDAADKGVRFSALSLSAAERIEGLGKWLLSGPLFRSWFVLAIALCGLLLAIAAPRRALSDRRNLTLLTIALLGALGVALLPMHSTTWQYFQPRFIPLAVLALVPLAPLERLGRRARSAAAAAFAFWAFGSNTWVALEHRSFAAQEATLLAGLGQAPPSQGRTLLPIAARPEIAPSYQRRRDVDVPGAAYILNVGQFYAIDRGAVTPYGFDNLPNVHLVTRDLAGVRATPKRDYGDYFAAGASPETRRAELARLASFAAGYDDVLFYGDEADAEVLLSHGFEVEVRREGFFIASYRGCPATITLQGIVASGLLHVGVRGSERFGDALPLPASIPATVHLDRASCVGTRAVVEAKTPSGEAVRCKPTGELRPDSNAIETADGERDLTCVLELAPSRPPPAE